MTDGPAAAPLAAVLPDGAAALRTVAAALAPHFTRSTAQRQALAYLQGLLSPASRKNSWQLAEIVGAANPYGFQHLLGRAAWDAAAVRDQLQTYVATHLGASTGILVVDETGFLKKGRASAGVARQYSGTAGRIENCQIGVFLSYCSPHGHTLVDRELYLPQEWIADPARCRAAGIPAAQEFATKPALALEMVQRAVRNGLAVQWVTGDCVYGAGRQLRTWLEAQPLGYVLAVSGKEYVWRGWEQQAVKTILAELPTDGWARHSAGAGTKGPRWFDWRWMELRAPGHLGWKRGLLVRRSVSDPTEICAYVVFAPEATPLADLVTVAGQRWVVEMDFATAKDVVGLDEYEVRSWTGWYRHMTLVLWALALLTQIQGEAGERQKKQRAPGSHSLATFKQKRGLKCA